jgi:hypothetical protein
MKVEIDVKKVPTGELLVFSNNMFLELITRLGNKPQEQKKKRGGWTWSKNKKKLGRPPKAAPKLWKEQKAKSDYKILPAEE